MCRQSVCMIKWLQLKFLFKRQQFNSIFFNKALATTNLSTIFQSLTIYLYFLHIIFLVYHIIINIFIGLRLRKMKSTRREILEVSINFIYYKGRIHPFFLVFNIFQNNGRGEGGVSPSKTRESIILLLG